MKGAKAILQHFKDPSDRLGFPSGSAGKEPICQCRRHKRCGFNSWVRKIPWSRKWQPSPVFLPSRRSEVSLGLTELSSSCEFYGFPSESTSSAPEVPVEKSKGFWDSLPSASGTPRWLSGKEPTCQCRRHKRCGFDPWVGKIPWCRKWQPAPVFLPGIFHGRRSLEGCSHTLP